MPGLLRCTTTTTKGELKIMARFIGASTRCVPWGLWIWFKDGRDYKRACRFDTPEDAENYARKRLADSDEVEQFAQLRRRPGKRERIKLITRYDTT